MHNGKWVDHFVSTYMSNVAIVFVLHGNTLDFVEQNGTYHKDPSALLNLYFADYEITFSYDKVRGWDFSSSPSSEQKCRRVLEKYREAEGRVQAANPGGPLSAAQRQQNVLQQQGIQPSVFPSAPAAAFAAMDKIFRYSDLVLKPKPVPVIDPLNQDPAGDPDESDKEGVSIGVIIDYAESLFSSSGWNPSTGGEVDANVMRILQWATDTDLRKKSICIVLVCRDTVSSLHPALLNPEASIEQLLIPYPKFEEREKFIDWFLTDPAEEVKELIDAEDFMGVKRLAAATAGLSYQMIDDCILRAVQAKSLTYDLIKDRKDAIVRMRYHDVLEVAEPQNGWEAVGGLDEIKEYMITNVAKPMRTGNYKRVPMGVLFMGPPGTGKTVMAEAIAKEAGILFVYLRLSKIFSKWVGDSERNLDRVLNAIDSLAPALVFMDEIDQAGHSRGNVSTDSGVGSRVFQRFLEYLSDTKHRGRVCFIGATNMPHLLDPAMKRSGRFDVHIPFFPPEAEDRIKVVRAICRKNNFRFKGEVSAEFLNKTKGWIGSDVETAVIQARNYYEDTWKKPTDPYDWVSGKALDAVIDHLLPTVSTTAIAIMTQLAIRDCNDYRLLPKRFRPAKPSATTLEDVLKNMGMEDDEITRLVAEQEKKGSEKELLAG